MTKVIGIRFRKAGKVYYFSPGENEIKTGDHVLVDCPILFLTAKTEENSLVNGLSVLSILS